jgi:hypothetical protein
MDNKAIKQLCLDLIKSDSELDVINILKQRNLWDNPKYWRYYGDQENNYSSAGNQADEAEAALIEKITNSRDAILMSECILSGINPKSNNAPNNVREAVALFFEEDPNHELAGQIREWGKDKRREVAKLMSVYLTGNKPRDGYPSINIVDKGEGQTPMNVPKTILSLGSSIKRSIRFVHGKWNMGGTAALVYCGKKNIQFVLSKRNPKILEKEGTKDQSDSNWGFTIVRREDPVGSETTSTYKYLAPVGTDEQSNIGQILNFDSLVMPIFAKDNSPYSVESEWGTLIKLYEYETSYKQSVQGSGGLLRPLDLLAPDLGLPFRLHECRYEGSKPGSFEHQVNGLRVRLHDQKDDVLEPEFPTYHNFENIDGEKFSLALYAFKEDKAKDYRESEKGVIFVLNGQSQGWMEDRIFTRNKVGLGYLKNSLLLMVDCSELSYRGQEKFFVNDRVHIRKGTEFFKKVEEEIIDYLATHRGLQELQEERKRKLRSEKIDDSKPLEAVLSSVFKHSSALSKIFLLGDRLSDPFRSELVKMKKSKYKGKQYPTYFKFRKLDYGKVLIRDAYVDVKSRILFETDANNDYFNRKTNKGTYKLLKQKDGVFNEVSRDEFKYSINLYNGIACLNIDLNSTYLKGDSVRLLLEVSDPMRIVDPPFINELLLNIKDENIITGGEERERIKPPDRIPGKDREKSGGISYPKIYKVYESEWEQHGFNKFSVIKVIKTKIDDGKSNIDFNFYINMSNIYLQHEIKENIEEKVELEAYFEYGMALIGISIIYDDQQNKNEDTKFEGIEERIADYSRAMGPFIIPIIKEFHEMDLKEELIKELT